MSDLGQAQTLPISVFWDRLKKNAVMLRMF